MRLPLPQLSQKQLAMIGAGIAVVVAFFVLIYVNLNERPPVVTRGTLVVWGVINPEEFRFLQAEYQRVHGGTTIVYNYIPEEHYSTYLLNALASGKSPDIFMIRNTWVPQYRERLVPMPNNPAFELKNPLHFRATFPQVVEEDFIHGGEIYALPVNLDTLALFYNKDLLNRAAIVTPPRTWPEFESAIVKLRETQGSRLVRPGAAIGGSEKTIAHASDLLALLLMQNGALMSDPVHARAVFISGGSGNPQAGLGAFSHYLQFANAGSPYYTWNENQEFSLDALREGRLAMAFGYLSDYEELEHVGKARIEVARVPQPAGSSVSIDYARYWGFGVSRLTPAVAASWDFISYVTTHAEGYLAEAGKVPATLPLLKLDVNDFRLSAFAQQALTARSWYQPESEVVRRALSDAIADVIAGRKTARASLGDAERKVDAAFHELLTR